MVYGAVLTPVFCLINSVCPIVTSNAHSILTEFSRTPRTLSEIDLSRRCCSLLMVPLFEVSLTCSSAILAYSRWRMVSVEVDREVGREEEEEEEEEATTDEDTEGPLGGVFVDV